MDTADRLLAAAKLAVKHLPESARKEFAALFEPQAIAITAAVLGVWAGSHAVGIGFAADLALLVIGVASIGFVAFEAADALRLYVTTAANAQSDQELDKAAQHLARAVTLLGVQTFVALITRGAAKRTRTATAYQSRVSRLDRLVNGVGAKVHLPEVRRRVYIALGFLEESFPNLPEQAILSRLKAIDFSNPVELVELNAGTKLISYRQAEYILLPERLMQGAGPVRKMEPLLGGSYYSVPGTPADRLGISSAGRELVRYQLTKPLKVLKSTAAGAKDTWTAARSPSFPDLQTKGGLMDTGELVGGGGVQYIIPDAKGALEVIGIGMPKL